MNQMSQRSISPAKTHQHDVPIHTRLDDLSVSHIRNVDFRRWREENFFLEKGTIGLDPIHRIANLRQPVSNKVTPFLPHILELLNADKGARSQYTSSAIWQLLRLLTR